MWRNTGLTKAKLGDPGRKLLRLEGKQVLVVAQEGRVFAIANRCPHEGYPLAEGTLSSGCILTCNWHNWKFDLATGNAIVGRDPVRTYPVEERDGAIFVDLSDPPAESQRARALAGLTQAITDNDAERMAREVARLARAGYPETDALVHAINVSHEHFEFGMTHAHGAASGWLALATRTKAPEKRLAALLEPIVHIAWDTAGAERFPYAGGSQPWDAEAFTAAVEREDESQAQRLIAGALDRELPYGSLRPALAAAALAHHAEFGHAAIYVVKTEELIEALGPEVAPALLRALVHQISLATREDRLPEFRGYARALGEWGKGTKPVRAEDLTGQSVDGALQAVLAASARPPEEIYDALMGAAAWNLLHFDSRFERATSNQIADNVGWLDFTHALTFGNAVRRLCSETPALWPNALLQLALFVGRNRKYVDPQLEVAPWHIGDGPAFIAREMEKLYDHGVPEPIIVAHRLKVLFALEEELEVAPAAPWGALMLAAVNRFLNAPMKRRHSLRTATQALDFIAREG